MFLQVVDVFAQLAENRELCRRDAGNQTVNFAAGFGEIGGQLAGDEGVRQMGDFQCAADAVVIRNSHKIHSRLFTGVVHRQRLHKTFRCADAAQEPLARAVRIFTVHMQVCFGSFHAPIRTFFCSRVIRNRLGKCKVVPVSACFQALEIILKPSRCPWPAAGRSRGRCGGWRGGREGQERSRGSRRADGRAACSCCGFGRPL